MSLWITPAIDMFIVEQRATSVSYDKITKEISARFNCNPSKSAVIGRAQTLGVPAGESVIKPRVEMTNDELDIFLKEILSGKSVKEQALARGLSESTVGKMRMKHMTRLQPDRIARDEEFKMRYSRGDLVTDIMQSMKISHRVACNWRDRLGPKRPPRMKSPPKPRPHRIRTKKPKQSAQAQPALACAQPRPSTHVSGTSSVFRFRGLALGTLPPAPERVAGRCGWPMTCDSPASGRYCPEHSGLLRSATRDGAATVARE